MRRVRLKLNSPFAQRITSQWQWSTNSPEAWRTSCLLAFTSPRRVCEGQRVPVSPKLHLLPPHSTSLMRDGCGGSGVLALSLGWRRVGIVKEVFYYWTTFSPVLCQEGNRVFLELLISRPVSGYGLAAIWNIGVVIRKHSHVVFQVLRA